MNKTYSEIISVVRGDIERLEAEMTADISFPDSSLCELLLAPAKRIRPALAFLFKRAKCRELTKEDFAMQTAVELAHNASLIHDDIVDFAKYRRGICSLNAKLGDKTAVLYGDYLLTLALNKIIDKPKILKEFLQTFSQMAQGEIYQSFTHFTIPTLQAYIDKTIQKTAGLFRLALLDEAENFGLNFGIAFQIKNDLADIDEDIKNGIFTAPVIFSGSSETITDEAVLNTKNLIKNYIEKAKLDLQSLPNNKYSQAIKEILELTLYEK